MGERCPACLGRVHRPGCPRQDVEAEALRRALAEEDADDETDPLEFL